MLNILGLYFRFLVRKKEKKQKIEISLQDVAEEVADERLDVGEHGCVCVD
jgi:hypothetical protein